MTSFNDYLFPLNEAHVRLNGEMSLHAAHEAVTTVERKLKDRFGASTLVTLHMEPLADNTC